MAPAVEKRTSLYRLFDAAGTLLYVGIANNPVGRWYAHSSSSDGRNWWPDVATLTIEWFATRAEAVAAESVAMHDEHPRYNIAITSPDGRTERMRWDAPPLAWSGGAPPKPRAGTFPGRRHHHVFMDEVAWREFVADYHAGHQDAMDAMLAWYLRKPFARLPISRAATRSKPRPEAAPKALHSLPITDADWLALCAQVGKRRSEVIRQLVDWHLYRDLLPARVPVPGESIAS